MNARRGVIAIGLTLAALLAAGPEAATRPAGVPAGSAVDGARWYADRMRSGTLADGFESIWDLDQLLASIYGDRMRAVTADDRAAMRGTMVAILRHALADPATADRMRRATYGHFTLAEGGDGGPTAKVRFDIHMPDGGPVVPNSLTFVRVGTGWRVVDCGMGALTMSASIRSVFQTLCKEIAPQTITPQQFMRVTADRLKQHERSAAQSPARK